MQTLLDAGATLIGKTITDEVSLGILGENAFDGTPLNTRAPDRVPGGSSSGSAAAVAAGLCDTALGTDTGGSVRVPASFCGLYGIRPTHGRLDLSGMLPQAPSSDTTGWFARDAATFARVSSVLLGEPIPTALPTRLVVAVDAFGFADPDVAAALRPMVERLAALIGEMREEVMAPQGVSVWSRAQRTLQPVEAWTHFRALGGARQPAHGVRRRARPGSGIDDRRGGAGLGGADAPGGEGPHGAGCCRLARSSACRPRRSRRRRRGCRSRCSGRCATGSSCLCSHGGLTGVPQVNLPGADVNGAPVGLSIVGGRGADAALVAVARAFRP